MALRAVPAPRRATPRITGWPARRFRGVTTSERDLVESLRAELAAVDPPRRCCRIAESAGLVGAFEPRRRNIARLALRLSRSRAGERPDEAVGSAVGREGVGARSGSGVGAAVADVAGSGAGSGVVVADVAGSGAGSGAAITAAAGSVAAGSVAAAAAQAGLPPPPFEWARSREHCRVAYLRGRFLAHGSLSLASGRTHLEFVLPPDEAHELCDRLGQLGLAASWRLRRGRGVVTWKSVGTVVTFLKLVGGGSSLLELEARQVSRTVRGDLNRVINAESANLTRAVAAAARQLEAIDALESDGRLAAQPYTVRLVVDARREEPEATFTELAERLGLHRSAVQRALERVERLALHPDEGVGKRGRERRA